jgi:hypothetical protein
LKEEAALVIAGHTILHSSKKLYNNDAITKEEIG